MLLPRFFHVASAICQNLWHSQCHLRIQLNKQCWATLGACLRSNWTIKSLQMIKVFRPKRVVKGLGKEPFLESYFHWRPTDNPVNSVFPLTSPTDAPHKVLSQFASRVQQLWPWTNLLEFLGFYSRWFWSKWCNKSSGLTHRPAKRIQPMNCPSKRLCFCCYFSIWIITAFNSAVGTLFLCQIC